MIFLWILLGCTAAYLLLIAIPAFISAACTLSRADNIPLEPGKYVGTYYDKYIPEIVSGVNYLLAIEHREISVTSHDGLTLRGEYFPGSCKNITVIMFHGFHAHPFMNFAVQAEYFHSCGYNMLFVYERAHLKSEGKYTGLGLTEADDVGVWVDSVKKLYPDTKILLYGASMGCTTLEFASDKLCPDSVCGMILDCGFVCPYNQMLQEARKLHLPARPMMPWVSLFYRLVNRKNVRSRTTDSLKNCKIPVLFIHGTEDTTVLPQNTELAFECCHSEKEYISVPDAAHTVAFAEGGTDIRNRTNTFINNCLKGKIQ